VPGQAYNAGGGYPLTNLEITRQILTLCGQASNLIRHVQDRKGHDRRYAIDCAKLRALGWQPRHSFEAALAATVTWYSEHQGWWRAIRGSEDFAGHYQRTYKTAQT